MDKKKDMICDTGHMWSCIVHVCACVRACVRACVCEFNMAAVRLLSEVPYYIKVVIHGLETGT